MTTHVEFVAILFVVWGALTAVVGLSTFALGIGAASLATSDSGGGQVAAGLTAASVHYARGHRHHLGSGPRLYRRCRFASAARGPGCSRSSPAQSI